MDKDQNLVILGQRIKHLRKEKGLTQIDLASRINKDQQSIQRLEAGGVNPSYLYLRDIAKGLGMKIDEILKID